MVAGAFPMTMTWTGSWNRYAYTPGEPVNRVDESGFDDTDANDCDPRFGWLVSAGTVPGIDLDIMIASQIANAAAETAIIADELAAEYFRNKHFEWYDNYGERPNDERPPNDGRRGLVNTKRSLQGNGTFWDVLSANGNQTTSTRINRSSSMALLFRWWDFREFRILRWLSAVWL